MNKLEGSNWQSMKRRLPHALLNRAPCEGKCEHTCQLGCVLRDVLAALDKEVHEHYYDSMKKINSTNGSRGGGGA